MKKNYTLSDAMPNQRAAGIINVSFSMPKSMAESLEKRARMEMTNRSEIVRRAVMAYLSPAERLAIQKSLTVNLETGVAAEPVGKYESGKSTKKEPKK